MLRAGPRFPPHNFGTLAPESTPSPHVAKRRSKMLERYFIRPETVDRIRACWLGDAIQTYVAWLTEQSYSSRCVIRRVPLFMRFGAFAHKRGATHIEELQGHLDAFVRTCLRRRAAPCGSKVAQRGYLRDVRKPIEQFLRVVQADHLPSQPAASPFEDWAPRFFEHLRTERGLSPTTVTAYSVQLARFEQYVVARRLPLTRSRPRSSTGSSPSGAFTSAPARSARRAPLSGRSCDTCSGRGLSAAISASPSTVPGRTISRRSRAQSPQRTSSTRWLRSNVVRSLVGGTTRCSCCSSSTGTARARSPL